MPVTVRRRYSILKKSNLLSSHRRSGPHPAWVIRLHLLLQRIKPRFSELNASHLSGVRAIMCIGLATGRRHKPWPRFMLMQSM
ncbi:hypothetical protein FIBSPDRAFT_374980 [Athelia psychrophila]|uniref:Uncharacterized protein n=1 Tax=Athelia psychrophila TaxID=1759441 RepID=A0A166VZ63_9AGAM|nr:hypothetical protein FIBSPDRAFT_374980 [Fibularhizoctonia sp. CBS 109695]